MSNEDSTANALAIGREKANEILARRRIARARRADALSRHPSRLELQLRTTTVPDEVTTTVLQSAGFLVAAGDSWFDYPFCDVLKVLEDNYGYNVESAAHAGDPIEGMAYQGGQLDEFARCIEKVLAHGVDPKAVLLSGGGDDIAGREFGMLLNNATSSISGWNSEIVDGVLNERISTAYPETDPPDPGTRIRLPRARRKRLLGRLALSRTVARTGIPGETARLDRNVGLLRNLIDGFNGMLAALVKEPAFGNVSYVDLRGTLSTTLDSDQYKDWWANELHPTEKGFGTVTAKFAAKLSTL